MLLLINPLMPFLRGARRRAPSRRVFLGSSFAVSAGSCPTPGPRGAPSGLLRRSCFCSRRRRFQANQLGEPLTKLESGRSRLRQESVKTACSNAISRAPRTGTAAARVMLGRALLFFWLKKWATMPPQMASEASSTSPKGSRKSTYLSIINCDQNGYRQHDFAAV